MLETRLNRAIDIGVITSKNLIYAGEAILNGRRIVTVQKDYTEAMETRLLGCYLVSIRKVRMETAWFPNRKGGIFRRGKEIKGLRGGVHRYAAQARPQIDAATAEKNRFRTETI